MRSNEKLVTRALTRAEHAGTHATPFQMSNAAPTSAVAKTPRAVGTVIATGCPLLLLGLYGFLVSPRGTRMYDAFASRNVGTGLVAFGLLMLVIAGILLVGLAAAAWAVLRREKPIWLARVVLALHVALVLLALRAVM